MTEQTYKEIVSNRVMLKPGDPGFKGHMQYAGEVPTANPRIDRNIIRRLYRQVNSITYIHYPYADNAIVAKKGQVNGKLIPGLLYSEDYVIVRQPNTRKMYALPYHVHQLAAVMGDMQIELYIEDSNSDRKVIITGGNSEAMINDTQDSPAFIEINNCDPFGQNDGIGKLQLAAPLLQYIKKKKEHYIAATAGYGAQLVTDGYSAIHTGDWHYCRPDDSVKFDYISGAAYEAAANVSLSAVQNMLPRYAIETRNELLLELTYANNQMPLLIKNKQSQIFISQHGIDLKGDDGDIHIPAIATIIPPRMKAPLLMIPSGFISDMAIIVSKSKKHVQDVLFRVYQHHQPDHRSRYFIEVSASGEKIALTCIVAQLSAIEEEEAARKQAASQAQAQAALAQEEEEAAARQSGQEEREERERVIREEQERRAREEAAAIEAARAAQAEEAAQERAAKLAKQLPADNYKDAMAIIANPKNLAVNYIPTYAIPKPQPNAAQWEIDAYIAQRYLRTMLHFPGSMIFFRDDIAGFEWRTRYILSDEHAAIFRKSYPKQDTTTNHESYIKYINNKHKALRDVTVLATGGGVITYRNGVQYVFVFEEVEPVSTETLAALSKPVSYNPGLAGIVGMWDAPITPPVIDSSDTPIFHPTYPEAKIEDAENVTKVIVSKKGSVIAVIEEHDITDITPKFTAPSILDEFEAPKPAAVIEAPAVIEAIEAPKPAAVIEAPAMIEAPITNPFIAVIEAPAVIEAIEAPKPTAVIEAIEAPTAVIEAPKPTAVIEAIEAPKPAAPTAVIEAIEAPKPAAPTAVIEAIEAIEAKPARIDYLQDEAALSSLLATLSQIAGINVMLVGSWLWVDGNTKPVKEQLKQLGFRWHQKKIMWFMALDQKYHKTRHNTDWSTIAIRYGVRTLKTKD